MQAVVVTAGRGVRIMQFGPLRISYNEHVLEPRPWTALQARWARQLAEVVPNGPVLELCAGAGQIGLMAIHGTARRLVAVDASRIACSFVQCNARAAGLTDAVDVRHERLSSACAPEERFPLIIADPPWVPHDEIGRFPQDPASAIDGGYDGLTVARQCLYVVADHLMDDGAALVQVGDARQVALLERSLPQGLVLAESRIEQGRGAVAKIVKV